MKVLVVDDDSISRMVLCHLLGTLGIFDVTEAEDGEKALLLLQHGLMPSICFCDGRMPNLSGTELLQRLKIHPQWQLLPFILVSASEGEESVQHALKLGAAGYIVKPFDVADIRQQLQKHVVASQFDLVEKPQASLHRLSLSAAQMQGYLQAFALQIEQASLQLHASLEQNQNLLLEQNRIRSLQHACQTLGLSYAAQVLDELLTLPLTAEQLNHHLRTVKNTVAHQISLFRAMQPSMSTVASSNLSDSAAR